MGCAYTVVGDRPENGSGLLWNRRQELRSGTDKAQNRFSVLHGKTLLELSIPPGDASSGIANTSPGFWAGIADLLLLYRLILRFSDFSLFQATFGLEKEKK